LAGIGRIESGHAGGGAVDARGTAVVPIYGPALDGTLPGNEVIVQSSVGNRVTYARAMGPMQFLPGTWARYASDGKGDGIADPQNLFDATLAAARYLCSGGLNLRDPAGVTAAILRYNNSMPYAQNVLGWPADECQRPAGRRSARADAADRFRPASGCRPATDVPVDGAQHPGTGADATAWVHGDLHRPTKPAAGRTAVPAAGFSARGRPTAAP
jgi:membrane-bound lytic murein transglycosylase B